MKFCTEIEKKKLKKACFKEKKLFLTFASHFFVIKEYITVNILS